MDPIFQEESARLSWTKEQYLQAAEDERLMLSALPRLYPNDPNLLNELLLHTHNRIVRLEQSRRKPYFARIDFTDGSSAQTDRCYIGKIGVADQDGQIITVDWRAPVATLYYDSNLGKPPIRHRKGRFVERFPSSASMRSKKERFYPIMMWTQFLTTNC